MLNRYKKTAAIIALSGATALTGLAYAQVRSPADGTIPAATDSTQLAQNRQADRRGAPKDWLNLGQIYDKLEASGYTDIREIERERDGYEAKARDSEGQSVKLYIEPLEGQIIDKKFRDREDRRDRDDRNDRD